MSSLHIISPATCFTQLLHVNVMLTRKHATDRLTDPTSLIIRANVLPHHQQVGLCAVMSSANKGEGIMLK
ncbi:hypothetical protein ACLOJK_028971 [Asimina triloba]